MDALNQRTVNTTKTLSAHRELLKRVDEIADKNNSWPEGKEAYVQIPIVEWNKTCHAISYFLLLSCDFENSISLMLSFKVF